MFDLLENVVTMNKNAVKLVIGLHVKVWAYSFRLIL